MLRASPSAVAFLRVRRRTLVFSLLTTFALFLSTTSEGQLLARTVPRGLDQLAQEADTVVHGYVTSSKVEPHSQLRNLNTVVVSIAVQDTYKGQARRNLVFRQFISNIDPQRGTSEYQKGRELVLLLGPVSEYGLTSPVGLDQGLFRVIRDSKGHQLAVNGRGNVGLFNSVQARAQVQGLKLSARTKSLLNQRDGSEIQLDDLADAVRNFARHHQ